MLRKNFSFRLQPRENTPLYEVIEWLESFTPTQRNQKISNALIMCYLFYARLDRNDSSPQQLITTALNSCNEGDKHFHVIKQILGICPTHLKENFHFSDVSSGTNNPNSFSLPRASQLHQEPAADTTTKNDSVVGSAPLTDLDQLFG